MKVINAAIQSSEIVLDPSQMSNSSKQRPLCLSGAFEFCHKGETAFSPLAFVQSHGSIPVQSEY